MWLHKDESLVRIKNLKSVVSWIFGSEGIYDTDCACVRGRCDRDCGHSVFIIRGAEGGVSTLVA